MQTQVVTDDLKRLLKQSGMRTKVAAETHLDISPEYLSSILSGRVTPGKRLLKDMVALNDKLRSSGLLKF